MAFSISNNGTPTVDPSSHASQIRPSGASQGAAAGENAAAALKSDSVKLSMAANIKLMYHQGLSLTLIASRLGVSVKQVESYIPGVSTAASAASAVLPTAPAATGSATAQAQPETAQ